MPRVTLNRVNAAITARGGSEVLVKGYGYFYFTEGNTSRWRRTAVYTCQLSNLTLEQWMQEYAELAGDRN